jgi:hypothetical protein
MANRRQGFSEQAEAAWQGFLNPAPKRDPSNPPLWITPLAITGLSVGLTSILFAIGDVTSPRDFARLMIGVVWLIAGVNGVVAACALVFRQPWWPGPTIAAGLSAIVIAGYILWADLRSPRTEPWTLAAGLLLAAGITSVLLTTIVVRITPRVMWKVFLTSVLPLFVLVQFWYTTQYAPVNNPPHVNLTTALEEVGRTQQTIALRGTIKIQNNSDTRVQVLGSLYRVTGQNLGEDTIEATADEAASDSAASEEATSEEAWNAAFLVAEPIAPPNICSVPID